MSQNPNVSHGIPDSFLNDKEVPPDQISHITVSESRNSEKEFWEVDDPTEVYKKNPDYHYHWVDQSRVEERKRQGYEIVSKKGREDAPCGSVVGDSIALGNGESILMACPRERYERKKKKIWEPSMERREELKKQVNPHFKDDPDRWLDRR